MLSRVFLLIILITTALGSSCTTESKGKQLTYHDNVTFYLPPISEEQAKKISDLYVQNGHFTAQTKNTIQVRRESNNYEVRVPWAPADLVSAAWKERFVEFACFQNKYALPELNLTYVMTEENSFEKVLNRYQSRCSATVIGNKITYGNNNFFFLSPIDQEQVLKVINYLISIDLVNEDTEFESQLISDFDHIELRLPSDKGLAMEGFSQTFSTIACGLGETINNRVNIVLIDYVGALESGGEIIARYICER